MSVSAGEKCKMWVGEMIPMGDPVTLSKFDFEDILIYAERYAIGRMTFAPHDVCNIINHPITRPI